jgi:hypothetical protein
MAWASEWAKEGKKVDRQKLLPPPQGFQVLPRRWGWSALLPLLPQPPDGEANQRVCGQRSFRARCYPTLW